MKDGTRIESIDDFVECSVSRRYLAYRGQGRESDDLTPKLGRAATVDGAALAGIEMYAMSQFKREAVLYADPRPASEWEWLCLAQHHGMPTRLLDWTRNALAALWFCVSSHTDTDGGVFLIRAGYPCQHDLEEFDPLDVRGCPLANAPHVSPRVRAQQGLFTVHSDPSAPLSSNKIEVKIVPSERKVALMRDLNRLGINHASMFPDLDGLARQVAFETTMAMEIAPLAFSARHEEP